VPRARQIGSIRRAGDGAQPNPAAILFDLDRAEVGEIIDDALPFKPATAAQ
jgi:hypothetical protein